MVAPAAVNFPGLNPGKNAAPPDAAPCPAALFPDPASASAATAPTPRLTADFSTSRRVCVNMNHLCRSDLDRRPACPEAARRGRRERLAGAEGSSIVFDISRPQE